MPQRKSNFTLVIHGRKKRKNTNHWKTQDIREWNRPYSKHFLSLASILLRLYWPGYLWITCAWKTSSISVPYGDGCKMTKRYGCLKVYIGKWRQFSQACSFHNSSLWKCLAGQFSTTYNTKAHYYLHTCLPTYLPLNTLLYSHGLAVKGRYSWWGSFDCP